MFTFVPRRIATVLFALSLATPAWMADSSAKKSSPIPTSASRSPATRATGKGPLPDPVLLDGSTHQAEKKSEYGMIGDFELPGDENARNGRVGGSQNPGQQQPSGGAGLPNILPQAGSPAAGQQGQQQANSQGQQGQQQGGGSGPENPDAAGKQVAGGGDPNAKAEGTQVAQLGGEQTGQQQGGTGEKPQPVAIGDSAMRIQTVPSAAGVIGSQQQIAGNTQHHEKGTGTGGKAPTGTQGNNRVEKGRTIPAGL